VRLFRRKGPPHRDHVGPADRWERIGRDGFDLLLRHGLREEHRVLDIGCGSLRFGRLLIPFLLPERYCGLEPAEDRVREGLAREVEAVYGPELLSRKAPRFDANPSFDLEVFGERFDLLFAFSVFIHCGREQLEACLRSAAKVMAPSSLFPPRPQPGRGVLRIGPALQVPLGLPPDGALGAGRGDGDARGSPGSGWRSSRRSRTPGSGRPARSTRSGSRRGGMSQPRVRACIVSYRSGASAVRAARSCLASGAEVVLVDNAPGDGTAELVRRELPEVEIREPGENLGFAAGSDLAAEGAATELLLFLNPDAELDPGSLATLAARMDAAPGTGIVGPAVRFRDGRPQPTIRGDPTPAALLYEYTVLRHLRIGRAAYVRYRTPAEPRSGTGVVEVLMGCALLVRRDLFEELGGFDRRYFMYYEEADLCRRVRDAGRTVEFVPRGHGRPRRRRERGAGAGEARVLEARLRPAVPEALLLRAPLRRLPRGVPADVRARDGRRPALGTCCTRARTCCSGGRRCGGRRGGRWSRSGCSRSTCRGSCARDRRAEAPPARRRDSLASSEDVDDGAGRHADRGAHLGVAGQRADARPDQRATDRGAARGDDEGRHGEDRGDLALHGGPLPYFFFSSFGLTSSFQMTTSTGRLRLSGFFSK
jgi:N-acetylglucosaminyl-diphospho-decaprenol L-rhamnosyltransferase